MKIDLKEMLEIIDVIKNEIVETMPNEIEIEDDYFWIINENDIFDYNTDPLVNEMGQISDEWMQLRRLLEPGSVPISNDLARLSSIFMFIRKNSAGIW